MMLILLIGSVFGGGFTPEVAVFDASDDPRSRNIVTALREVEDIKIKIVWSEDDVVDAVSRGEVQAGLVIPSGITTQAEGGQPVAVRYFGRQDTLAPQLRSTVNAIVARESAVLRAALFTQSEAGTPLDEATQQAEIVLQSLPELTVVLSTVGEDLITDTDGFDASASAELLLFVFLTSLTGSVALIETRNLGISRRMLSTPTSARALLFGEALGRYSVGLLQGLIIMGGSALLFGVGWGNPVAAVLIMLLFALVGAGAGMLVGSVLTSEQQALSVGLLVGLGGAAIGGSMVPLEIFPDVLRTIAHVTPHAWGNDAFATLLQDGGGVADIGKELGILAAYAAGLLLISSWLFRRKITAG